MIFEKRSTKVNALIKDHVENSLRSLMLRDSSMYSLILANTQGTRYLHLFIYKLEIRDHRHQSYPFLLQVLFYTGQFDILVPYIHTATFLDNLDWEGVSGFYSSKHSPWMRDGTLVGYWKTHRSLSHVLIRNAGHMVGASQPKYLFEMLKKFVNDEVSDPQRFKREDEIE